METVSYEVKRELAELSANGRSRKVLSLVSWNGNQAKLDLRNWRNTDYGEQPGKGVTITDKEADILATALEAYQRDRLNGQ